MNIDTCEPHYANEFPTVSPANGPLTSTLLRTRLHCLDDSARSRSDCIRPPTPTALIAAEALRRRLSQFLDAFLENTAKSALNGDSSSISGASASSTVVWYMADRSSSWCDNMATSEPSSWISRQRFQSPRRRGRPRGRVCAHAVCAGTRSRRRAPGWWVDVRGEWSDEQPRLRMRVRPGRARDRANSEFVTTVLYGTNAVRGA